MEYDIEDWAIKVKIGGLGVMAQLMGKNLGHQDLIWVVPAVGGIEYPEDQPADSMDITIMGKPYQIQVQHHVLNNITYVILDAPIFRAQSKAEPYPERMDDMDSAIFYSAWNQCIALAIKRFQPDLYHINDYHGALAPVHLLPNTIPCVLSLHNAEFQGLWGMRTPEELGEVCKVYNIPVETAKKYVQFGDVFNLLHAGASYLRIHQKGFGAVGVSKKYGKRSWARYPIFWGLNKIGQLPNPDPSDTADWSGQQDQTPVEIDEAFESSRGSLRRQAQEWAGLDVDEEAELLVFVGRWSMQKGIDLIADAMPALLEENPKVQLICVGPVIDLYGKFAALKLDVLMKKYPGRVFSKPEFTALPPFIFSGAEFALIPSRDEPFGLVAVEFGRKGALGIGARVGGLGQMPGWWFTVEATTTSHLLHQFKRAIKDALSSKKETRVEMRARSAKQRFPVAQWVEDLEKLQSTAIQIHEKEASNSKGDHSRPRSRTPMARSRSPAVPSPESYQRERARSSSTVHRVPGHARSASHEMTRAQTGALAVTSTSDTSRTGRIPVRPSTASPSIGGPAQPERAVSRSGRSLGRPISSAFNSSTRLNRDRSMTLDRARSPLGGFVYSGDDVVSSAESSVTNSPYLMPVGGSESFRSHRRNLSSRSDFTMPDPGTPPTAFTRLLPDDGDEESFPDSAFLDDDLLLPPSGLYQMENVSTLSLEEVIGDNHDFSLQKVDPSFTDGTEEYFNAFKAKLGKLNASNSEDELCIEAYLVKSEKAWFTKFRAAKLGKSAENTPSPSMFSLSRPSTPRLVPDATKPMLSGAAQDEFHLDKFYKPPKGFRKYLQYRIGDWPLYTILLALGQIMGANSYQITLLSGPRGQNEEKFYIVSGIYLAASVFWWVCYRCFKSIHLLSVPFLLYGVSLLLLATSPYFSTTGVALPRLQNSATALYTVASASGSLYFALNFGDEGGSPAKSWVFRACVIQGTQQVYIAALWFWGSHLNHTAAIDPVSKTITPILFTASGILFLIGLILYTGLPSYYRQTPGKLPSLYTSLFRRKIVIWFFLTVLIQNFFLSTLTARNWTFLWSSQHAQPYQVALLALLFLVLLWAAVLHGLGLLARTHTWILPILAISLGAPRWAQILWSCTPISASLPWAGTSPLASALVARALWLHLGLLDALQGVGLGMILLQTLTRVHISATLVGAQVLGAAVTMLARARGPDRLGPGSVFPDLSRGVGAMASAWFWVGLAAQMVVCAGFFKFFRKEQLSKP